MKYSNTDIERIIIAQEEKSPGEMLKFLKNELLESVGSYYLDYKRYKREDKLLKTKDEMVWKQKGWHKESEWNSNELRTLN